MTKFQDLKNHTQANKNIELMDIAENVLDRCSGCHLDEKIDSIQVQLRELRRCELRKMDSAGKKTVDDYPY